MDWEGLGEPLAIDQIDFRVQSINKGGYATILAYKDARVDMDRLDKVVGRGKWQRKHERIGETLYCSVGLYNDEINEWVWVQDVGVPSNAESQKGEASDAFKRACFNLGIGRELYEFPAISVKLNKNEFEIKKQGNYDKAVATWNLKVREWSWAMDRDDAGIVTLTAKDEKGALRYQWQRSFGTNPYTEEQRTKFMNYLDQGTPIEFRGYAKSLDDIDQEIIPAICSTFPDNTKTTSKKWVGDKSREGLEEIKRRAALAMDEDEELRETAFEGLNDLEKKITQKYMKEVY